MKLDVGSAECPMVPYDEWIHVDVYDSGLASDFGLKRVVDVIADAHYLPFRDSVFDEVFSGATVLTYTGTKAVSEIVRVTKPNGIIVFRQNIETVPLALQLMNELGCSLLSIQSQNMTPYGEVLDVMLKWKKSKSEFTLVKLHYNFPLVDQDYAYSVRR
ncbi:MAG: methyltransferase domain-containing protein [Candidatus Thorarchaeota archaeon]